VLPSDAVIDDGPSRAVRCRLMAGPSMAQVCYD